jgi:predicted transposase YbfD/YdcC
MDHPEWASKFKTKNTELRLIRGRYYLYKIKSEWDPKKQRARKITLESLGTITEIDGLIPAGMSRKGRPPKGGSRLKKELDETGFLDSFSVMTDQRSTKNQLYIVGEILLLTVCAILCGAEGWVDIENYGKVKLDFLRTYFDYENGIPSDDTLRRFYRSINPSEFEKFFREWVHELAQETNTKLISIESNTTSSENEKKVLAIDGKCLRRSYDEDGNMLHIVSAFSTESRIVLGQEKVSEKSNEITAIPKLLNFLDIKNHIITIDAMGCQFLIADLILEKEGDYIFSLKGNQGNLSKDVRSYFEDINIEKIDKFIDYDKGHGRIETRECFVVTDVKWLTELHLKWNTIKSIILIRSKRDINGKIETESRYYISSLTLSPNKILKAIRSHWAIENSLHWVLDMSFNEDYSRIRKGNAPHIMAILRHVAANLLQTAKKNRQSIKGLRKLCGWDDSTLKGILSQSSS